MKQIIALVLLLNLVVVSHMYDAANAASPTQEKGTKMKGSHVHLGVKDLPAALQWLDKVWQVRPTFQNERMASLPFGELTIILDASAADTAATVGFESQNCDDDFRAVKSRGGVALEEPKDRPWGVRSAYVQGPGGLKFEIEQMLPRSK
jgi:catechol 2,3-dioxygenase-like lactoylglutathione lyase family enzyme